MNATDRQSFRQKLRQELDRQSLGVRGLARRLEPDRDRVEHSRRLLNKYLAGAVNPSTRTRERIEDALGVERGSLADDPEEEPAQVFYRTNRERLVIVKRLIAEAKADPTVSQLAVDYMDAGLLSVVKALAEPLGDRDSDVVCVRAITTGGF